MFSSQRKWTQPPHLTQKGEQKIGLQLLSFCVCGYKTWKPGLPAVPREAAGTDCHLLADAHTHHFRNYWHRAESYS